MKSTGEVLGLDSYLGSAYAILFLDFGVAQQFGYYHLVISISMLYLMYKRFTGEGISWK